MDFMGKLARPLMEFTWICSSKIAYVFSELLGLDHREYRLNYPNWFPPMLAKLVAQDATSSVQYCYIDVIMNQIIAWGHHLAGI
jgi:hypothetical protein